MMSESGWAGECSFFVIWASPRQEGWVRSERTSDYMGEWAYVSVDRGRGYFTSLTMPPRRHERRGCEVVRLLCVMGSPAAKERGE